MNVRLQGLSDWRWNVTGLWYSFTTPTRPRGIILNFCDLLSGTEDNADAKQGLNF